MLITNLFASGWSGMAAKNVIRFGLPACRLKKPPRWEAIDAPPMRATLTAKLRFRKLIFEIVKEF